MFGLNRKSEDRERSLGHATRKDFERIFSDDMSALHLLALLLTADPAKAEQCFVGGLEESIRENPVFRQWARTWSKRVIIRNAIEMLAPAPGQTNPSRAALTTQAAGTERDALMSVVWELPPFERFVFVITVLEGNSLSDGTSLLGCKVTDLTQARSRALSIVALTRGVGGSVPHNRRSVHMSLLAKPEMA